MKSGFPAYQCRARGRCPVPRVESRQFGIDPSRLALLAYLVLWPLATESEKSEQKSSANLLGDLFGAVRNPLARAPKTNWPMSAPDGRHTNFSDIMG